MKLFSKTIYFFISILLSLIYSRNLIDKNQSISNYSNLNSNGGISLGQKYKQLTRSESNVIIWEENFENGVDGWLNGTGWDLTENKSHTPNHSMFSPDDNTTIASNDDGEYYLLFSPKIC